MAEFFDYDPISGIRTDTAFNENTGEMTVYRTADVEPILDAAKAQASAAGKNLRGIRESWWQYCTIPPVVQLQLRAKGLDISRSEHMPRVLQEINENYPHLKVVEATEGGKPKKVFLG